MLSKLLHLKNFSRYAKKCIQLKEMKNYIIYKIMTWSFEEQYICLLVLINFFGLQMLLLEVKFLFLFVIKKNLGTPGWFSQLSIQLLTLMCLRVS